MPPTRTRGTRGPDLLRLVRRHRSLLARQAELNDREVLELAAVARRLNHEGIRSWPCVVPGVGSSARELDAWWTRHRRARSAS
jgi:hypothetical protein